jgi:hypothetical protein
MDSRYSGPTLSKDLVTRENMLVVRRKTPISVTTADGSPMKGAGEYYTTPYCMRIGSHQEDISWEVAQIEKDIAGYLPMSWLYLHNPDVEWDTGIIRWRSPYCKKHCLPMTSPKEVMELCTIMGSEVRRAANFQPQPKNRPQQNFQFLDNNVH